MNLKEAFDVLMKFAEWLEELEKGAPKPLTMDEIADALWAGEFDHEFSTKKEFGEYMHRLLKSDLIAKERKE